jgi:hypothetical protein
LLTFTHLMNDIGGNFLANAAGGIVDAALRQSQLAAARAAFGVQPLQRD